jgi:hypothetical protein
MLPGNAVVRVGRWWQGGGYRAESTSRQVGLKIPALRADGCVYRGGIARRRSQWRGDVQRG